MDPDRQAIERRDFPIARRGYDPAAVDAHLRALADEIERLSSARAEGGEGPSLAASAGTQVQSILHAAETAAADIERQARESADAARQQADGDARRTRDQAVEQARTHVGAVAAAASALLERVGSMDGELSAIVESLRGGASRLAGDLAAVDTNMGELYDAATGKGAPAVTPRGVAGEAAQPPREAPSSPPLPSRATPSTVSTPSPRAPRPTPSAPKQRQPEPADASHARDAPAPAPAAVENGDLDGARLTVLNMALDGESRAQADRYLAEHFQLADREKLIDEVYAAVEG